MRKGPGGSSGGPQQASGLIGLRRENRRELAPATGMEEEKEDGEERQKLRGCLCSAARATSAAAPFAEVHVRTGQGVQSSSVASVQAQPSPAAAAQANPESRIPGPAARVQKNALRGYEYGTNPVSTLLVSQ